MRAARPTCTQEKSDPQETSHQLTCRPPPEVLLNQAPYFRASQVLHKAMHTGKTANE